MMVFLALGALDFAIGNKFGLGAEFEKGFLTCGKLLLLMSGFICLAPVISNVLCPLVAPLFEAIGADPAMFAGMILASDAGAAPLAAQMANSPEAGKLGGLIVGAVVGSTITFTIPVSIASTKGDKSAVIYGLLAGIITTPFGVFLGGLSAGYSVGMLLVNTLPILIFAGVLFVLLLVFKERVVRVFSVIGNVALGIAYIGAAAAAVESMTGLVIIPGMDPIEEVFPIVGNIALMLAGAFPLMAVIRKVFSKVIGKIARAAGTNEVSISTMLVTTANSIGTFTMINDMDRKGKLINVAFAVSGAWLLGDHLAFVAQYDPTMVMPTLVAKGSAAVLAIVAAVIMYRFLPKEAVEEMPERIPLEIA